MLDYCKMILRITNDDFNDEIQALINACISDLKIAGVEKSDDPIYKQAVALYVKGSFGWENPDAGGLLNAYNNLKKTLATTKKYGEVLHNERASQD